MPRIKVICVTQWLDTWNMAEWAPDDGLPEPPHEFFIGSVSIRMLRDLAGVSRRQISERRAGSDAPGYQRAHETDRSNKIARYISYGYPFSTSKGLNPEDHRDLIHPGWLPTSIIVNVMAAGETRRRGGRTVELMEGDAIRIIGKGGGCYLNIPEERSNSAMSLEPLEIVDGQHRIFSVDALEALDENYEVPVVFFDNLTEAWQAYLFWVINVEPKKINPSLAFDLYPELRSQTWLERGEGIKIYQEHRAQEITEALWRHESSVWRDRIELFGNRIDGHVSNAAFIRSLMATFVRRWGAEHRIGGLFGSIDKEGKERVLQWKRAQQIAFLIEVWREMSTATSRSSAAWALACRDSYSSLNNEQRAKINPHGLDPAFAGPYSLLGTDQGVRAILYVFNALCQVFYSEIGLEEWELDGDASSVTSEREIDLCLKSLRGQTKIISFVKSIASSLVQGGFDWRTSSEPSLKRAPTDSVSLQQASYRGSSGYKLLQQGALHHLMSSKNEPIRIAAEAAAELVGLK